MPSPSCYTLPALLLLWRFNYRGRSWSSGGEGSLVTEPSQLLRRHSEVVIHADLQPRRSSHSREHDGRDAPVETRALKEGDCPDGGDGQIAPLLGHLQNFRQSGQQQYCSSLVPFGSKPRALIRPRHSNSGAKRTRKGSSMLDSPRTYALLPSPARHLST